MTISARFKKDHDLKVDGYLEPGGETVTAMAAQLRKKQKAAQSPSKTAQKKAAEEKPAAPAVPAPPDYRKEVFKGSRRAEWEEFHNTLEKRQDLTPRKGRSCAISSLRKAAGTALWLKNC